MNKDNEPQKLIINSEEIIPILLKHLMLLKNENAFLKNYQVIQSFTDGIPKSNIGINNVIDGILEKDIGINKFTDGTPEKDIGIDNLLDGTVEKYTGINNVTYDKPEKDIGINNVPGGIPENNIGIKTVFSALRKLQPGVNSVQALNTIFEHGLTIALNDYIKNGNGQNTLYTFYQNFLEAVANENTAAENDRKALTKLRLEDTHVLPVHILRTPVSLSKLQIALRNHLPRNAKWDLSFNISNELLLLHNNGKATGTALRNSAGLSVPGFAKHLPKLKRYNLIGKEPPLNYVLTDFDKHILLQVFGVPKE